MFVARWRRNVDVVGASDFKRLTGDEVNIESGDPLRDIGGEAAKQFRVGGGEGSSAERERSNKSTNLPGNDYRRGKRRLYISGKILGEDQAGFSETLTADPLAGLNLYANFGGEPEGGSAKKLVSLEQGDGNAVRPSGLIGEVRDLFQLVEEYAGVLDGNEIADRGFLHGGDRFFGRRRLGNRNRIRAAEWTGTHTNNSDITESHCYEIKSSH